MKKIINIFLILLFFPKISNATAQIADILIWKGDTLSLYSNPLEQREDYDMLRAKIIKELKNNYQQVYGKELSFSTDCWRQYIAEWKIINDSIFLSNIYACYGRGIKINLEQIFPGALKSGLLFAKWINDELIVPKGNCIEYVHLGYMSVYEKEIVLKFEKGLLNDEKIFNNAIIKESKFMADSNLNNRLEYIYSRVRWDSLPDLKNRNIQVFVGIQPTRDGKIDSIRSEYTYSQERDGIQTDTDTNNVFIKETLRIAKLIPDWDVILQRGEILSVGFSILFNDNQKKKYFLQEKEK